MAVVRLAIGVVLGACAGAEVGSPVAERLGPSSSAGSARVSQRPIGALLPEPRPPVFAHLLGWFGSPKHIAHEYRSDDPAQIRRQLDALATRGVEGVVLDWYGALEPIVDRAAEEWRRAGEAHGFRFAIMLDGGIARWCGCADPTRAMIDAGADASARFFPSPAYLRHEGRPVLFLFDVEAAGVDLDRLAAGLPAARLVERRAESLARVGGGFAWIALNPRDPDDAGRAQLERFHAEAAARPEAYAVGAVWKGFDDRRASWGSGRVMHERCGQTWLDTFAALRGADLDLLQLATWNDEEEGTGIESGIDACLHIDAWTAGDRLEWRVDGNLAALEGLEVFRERGGRLFPLARLEADARAFGLEGLEPGDALRVIALGRPFIREVASAPVPWR